MLRSGFACLIVLISSTVLVAQETPRRAALLSPQQQEQLKERDRLAAEADRHGQAGRFQEMVQAWDGKLKIEREVLDPQSEEALASLETLAGMRQFLEEFDAARQARQEILDAAQERYGEKNWRTRDARRALEKTEKLAGLSREKRDQLKQFPSFWGSGQQMLMAGRFRDALEFTRRAAEIQSSVWGEESEDYATASGTLGLIHQYLGEFKQAEALLKQFVESRRKTHGEDHPEYAKGLSALGLMHRNMGQAEKAIPLCRQSSRIMQEAYGNASPHYAVSLNELAGALVDQQEAEAAESTLRESLEIFARLRLQQSHQYADALSMLSTVHQQRGELKQAESLLRQVLEVRRKAFGERHPTYAGTLHNLAALLFQLRDFARAETVGQEAVSGLQAAHGENHPDCAKSLSLLGLIRQGLWKLEDAEAAHRQALEILEATRGESHPETAVALHHLSLLLHARGDFRQAEAGYRRVLEILDHHNRQTDPDYLRALNNLALALDHLGNYDEAEAAYRRVQEQLEDSHRQSHPDYGVLLTNRANLALKRRDLEEAAEQFRQALAFNERWLDDLFSVLAERQRLRIFAAQRLALDGLITAHVDQGKPLEELYPRILSWKGAVASRRAEERAALRQPELADLLERLRRARSGLARLAFLQPAPGAQQEWAQNLQTLLREKETLESELAMRSEPFRRLRESPDPLRVRAALPPDTRLVDYFEYRHLLPPREGGGKFGKENRLLAFVSAAGDKQVVGVSLGPADSATQAIQECRRALSGADLKSLDVARRQVHQRLWEPLLPYIEHAATVLVSPDGAISQLPLAILPGREQQYLIEETAIGYVASGRQLAALAISTEQPPVDQADVNERSQSGGILAVGGVDYGAAAADSASSEENNEPAPGGEGLTPLPGTELEAKSSRDLFLKVFPDRPAVLVTGSAATEAEIKDACQQGYRYLHLATHGFFESPRRLAAQLRLLDVEAVGEFVPMKPLGAPDNGQGFDEQGSRALALAPLLKSGLALAGAAATGQATVQSDPDSLREDGLLTAEETASLDLLDVDLVVLSACDTGLGEVEHGEGVIGLARAFQTAGARSVVASLWKIDDAATNLLMEAFYKNLWEREMPKLEALRQAQLYILRHPEQVQEREKELASQLDRAPGAESRKLPGGGRIEGRSHPWLWAAFVLSGDSR